MRIDQDKAVLALNLLVEGNSIRSTERLTGLHRDTILDLLVLAGERCERLMDERMRGFRPKAIEADEIWSFVGKKEGRLGEADNGYVLGDQYTFVSMDADTKLIISYRVGKRNSEDGFAFVCDLSERVDGRVQITTNGWQPYISAIEEYFGGRADFARVVKVYGTSLQGGRAWYRPVRVMGAVHTVMSGRPDPERISTSFIERQNLTIRMQSRRFTRLTNAFSKKLDNMKAAVALHFAHYNFCRAHRTLKVIPAMEGGLADHVWSIQELIGIA
jgi:IS1 family transposase